MDCFGALGSCLIVIRPLDKKWYAPVVVSNGTNCSYNSSVATASAGVWCVDKDGSKGDAALSDKTRKFVMKHRKP